MKILISVISYNEEASIEGTLNDLIAHNFGYDVVVVDNGSNDKTYVIASVSAFRSFGIVSTRAVQLEPWSRISRLLMR